MIRQVFVTLGLVLAVVAPALSQPQTALDAPRRNPQEQRAFDEGCDENQANMHMCASFDLKVLDARLNSLYRKQMARLKRTPLDLKRLQEAQRAWLRYTEADCLYQNGTSDESGSIWPMLEMTCRIGHWNDRIRLLQSYVDCTQDGCKGD